METQVSVAGEADINVPTDTEQPTETSASESPQDPYAEFKGKKFKVKYDSKEEEVDFDTLLKDYGKGKSADKRFMEAAKIRKEVEKFVQDLQEGNDYNQLVKLMGKEKAEKFAEQLLLEKIQYEELPDHEKTRIQLEREKKELEERLSAREKAELEDKRKQATIVAVKQIDEEISGALKELGRKPTPRLVARIAENMLASMDSSESAQRLPAKTAMQQVLTEFKADLAEYLGSLSPEEARKVLPKNLLDGLRKADVDAVTSPFHNKNVKSSEQQASPKQTSKKNNRMKSEDWFSRMEKRFG